MRITRKKKQKNLANNSMPPNWKKKTQKKTSPRKWIIQNHSDTGNRKQETRNKKHGTCMIHDTWYMVWLQPFLESPLSLSLQLIKFQFQSLPPIFPDASCRAAWLGPLCQWCSVLARCMLCRYALPCFVCVRYVYYLGMLCNGIPQSYRSGK